MATGAGALVALMMAHLLLVKPLTFDMCHGDSCFAKINSVNSFDSGTTECFSHCAHMASIHSPEEQAIVESLTGNKKYWIGMRLNFFNHSKWIDGTLLNFTKFAEYPTIADKCSYATGTHWRADRCVLGGFGVICKRNGVPCGDPFPPSANASVQIDRQTAWNDAPATCFPPDTVQIHHCDPECLMPGGLTHRELICGLNGTWIGPEQSQLTCSCPVLCPDPPIIAFSVQSAEPETNPQLYPVNSSIQYTCTIGRVWQDDPETSIHNLTCQLPGIWTTPDLTTMSACVIPCPTPPTVAEADAYIILGNASFPFDNETDIYVSGDVVHYTCWPGSFFQGTLETDISIECNEIGSWGDGIFPRACEIPLCFLPVDTGLVKTYLYITGNLTTFLDDQNLVYDWDVNGTIVDSNAFQNGTFLNDTSLNATCLTNGTNTTSLSLNESCIFSNTSHVNDTLDPHDPSIDFTLIGDIDENFNPGTVIVSKCPEGTVLPHSRKTEVHSTCHFYGVWMDTSWEMDSRDVYEDCVETCHQDIPSISNAFIRVSNATGLHENINGTWVSMVTGDAKSFTYIPGDNVTYVCKHEHAFVQSRTETFTMNCTDGGLWSARPRDSCELICPPPPSITNASLGTPLENFYFPGDTARYTCNPGTGLGHPSNTDITLHCDGSRSWNDTGVSSTCVTFCTEPPVLDFTTRAFTTQDAQITAATALYLHGDVVTYTCHNGQVFNHSDKPDTVATCLDTGVWGEHLSASNNRCVATCPEPPSINLAHHILGISSVSSSSSPSLEDHHATTTTTSTHVYYQSGSGFTTQLALHSSASLTEVATGSLSTLPLSSSDLTLSTLTYAPSVSDTVLSTSDVILTMPDIVMSGSVVGITPSSYIESLKTDIILSMSDTAPPTLDIWPSTTESVSLLDSILDSLSASHTPLSGRQSPPGGSFSRSLAPSRDVTTHSSTRAPPSDVTSHSSTLEPPTDAAISASQTIYKDGDIAKYVCVYGYRFSGDSTRQTLLCQGNGTWNYTSRFPNCTLIPSTSMTLGEAGQAALPGQPGPGNLPTESISQETSGPTENLAALTESVSELTTLDPGVPASSLSLTVQAPSASVSFVTPITTGISTTANTPTSTTTTAALGTTSPTTTVQSGTTTSNPTTAILGTTSPTTTVRSGTTTSNPTTVKVGTTSPAGGTTLVSQPLTTTDLTTTGISETIAPCDHLDPIDNAQPDINISHVIYPGTIVEFTCSRYHQFPDRSRVKRVTCAGNGTWTEQLPHCAVIEDCEFVPNVTNTAVNTFTNISVGSTVFYTCTRNWTFPDGMRTRRSTCTADGFWWPIIPQCLEYAMTLKKRRKHDTVPLEAPGAIAVGSFGLIIMLGIIITIVVLDAPTLVLQARQMKKNVNHFLKRYLSAR